MQYDVIGLKNMRDMIKALGKLKEHGGCSEKFCTGVRRAHWYNNFPLGMLENRILITEEYKYIASRSGSVNIVRCWR